MSLTPLRRGLAALSLLVILAGCGTSQQPRSDAPPPRALAPPRVLVSTPGLFAFAQDGGQLAWWRDEPGDAYPALHIRTIATGAETRIRGRDALPGFGGDGFSITFAFAGGRALWSDFSHGNFGYEHLKTASLSDRSVRTLDEWEYLEEGEEHDFNMAGDGTTLVYTIGGSPMRVAGPKAVPVPGAPEAFAVAVSGRRAALLRQAGIDDNYRPFSDENTPVEVRDVQTGELLGRFKHSGRATAVALAPGLVVLLVHEESSTRIETYSVDDGHRQATADVPSDATDLSIAGETVVFSSAQTIHVLNARSGRESTVAVAKGTPIGLSIEGRRIAWGENGRIVAVYLSPH